MAEAELEREQRRLAADAADGGSPKQRPAQDAGSRFGAFHRGRQSGSGTAAGTAAGPGSEPPAAP
jgi:hypothetical protein